MNPRKPGDETSETAESKRVLDLQIAADEEASKLQRLSRLQSMIEKRQSNFSYIKKIHSGDSFWLNSVLLRHSDLVDFASRTVTQTYVIKLFLLGLSIGKILDMGKGPSSLRAVAQLFDEWDYYFCNRAMQSMKSVTARNCDYLYPQLTHPDHDDLDQLHVGLHKFHNEVTFEYLLVSDAAIPIDYFEMIYSLCDIMSALYSIFDDESIWSNPRAYSLLERIDAKVKHSVINSVAKEIGEYAIEKVTKQIVCLKSAMFV